MNINDITIKYFSNKNVIIPEKIINEEEQIEEDKKFYEKRIIDLTKKMFKNNGESQQLKRSFNRYIKECIEYFKFKDYSDLHQEDLSVNSFNLNDVSNNMLDVSDLNQLDISHLVNDAPKKVSLDNFVLKKKNKKKILLMPKEIKYNLKDPKLKDKDIIYDISKC